MGVKMEKGPSKIDESSKKKQKKYRSFREARIFARRQKITTAAGWHDFARSDQCPSDIPGWPDRVYPPTLWKGYVDFLGSDQVKIVPPTPVDPLNRPTPRPLFLGMSEAIEVVSAMELSGPTHYRQVVRQMSPRPFCLPRYPEDYYGSEWVGWRYFLGLKRFKRAPRPDQVPPTPIGNGGIPYRPLKEAVKYVSGLGLRDRPEWLLWRRTYPHADIPWKPEEYYGEEWCGWSIFLGHDPLPGLLENVAVMYVGKSADDPSNVYHVGINNLGKSDLMHRAARENFRVVRMWRYEPELREEVRDAIAANCSGWYGSDSVYLVPNLFGLYSDLFNLLAIVT